MRRGARLLVFFLSPWNLFSCVFAWLVDPLSPFLFRSMFVSESSHYIARLHVLRGLRDPDYFG